MADLFPKERYYLIERTSKHEAYQNVYMWGVFGHNADIEDPTQTVWYAQGKLKSHLKFLQKHYFRYDSQKGFIRNDGYYNNMQEVIDAHSKKRTTENQTSDTDRSMPSGSDQKTGASSRNQAE